jgi:hypothetical protein
LRVNHANLRTIAWTVAAIVTVQSSCLGTALSDESATPSDCPAHNAVAFAVRGLLSQSHVEIANIESSFEIRDLGRHFIINVQNRTRDFVDDPHDCVRRVRVAAVFIALTLAPPDIGLNDLDREDPLDSTTPSEASPPSNRETAEQLEATTPPPETVVPLPTPAAPQPVPVPAPKAIVAQQPRPDSWRVEPELGGTSVLALRSSSSVSSVGAELRIIVMKEAWGLTAGASLTTADDLILGTSRIRQLRYPVDVGLRWNLYRNWLTTSADVSLLATILQLQQTNVAGAPRKTQLELGGRAGITLRLGRSSIAPFARGFLELIPFPHQLAVEPRGPIGNTTAVWLGATVGLAGSFH